MNDFSQQCCVHVIVDRRQGAVVPLCLSAFDRNTGELAEAWLPTATSMPCAPFDADATIGTADVGAMVAAFGALNLPMPRRIIDLAAEARNAANGQFAATNLHQLMAGLGARPPESSQLAYAESLAGACPVAGSPDAEFVQQTANKMAIALHRLWSASVSAAIPQQNKRSTPLPLTFKGIVMALRNEPSPTGCEKGASSSSSLQVRDFQHFGRNRLSRTSIIS